MQPVDKATVSNFQYTSDGKAEAEIEYRGHTYTLTIKFRNGMSQEQKEQCVQKYTENEISKIAEFAIKQGLGKTIEDSKHKEKIGSRLDRLEFFTTSEGTKVRKIYCKDDQEVAREKTQEAYKKIKAKESKVLSFPELWKTSSTSAPALIAKDKKKKIEKPEIKPSLDQPKVFSLDSSSSSEDIFDEIDEAKPSPTQIAIEEKGKKKLDPKGKEEEKDIFDEIDEAKPSPTQIAIEEKGKEKLDPKGKEKEKLDPKGKGKMNSTEGA